MSEIIYLFLEIKLSLLQSSSPGNFPPTAQVATREQKEDQVKKATFLNIEENSYKKSEKSTDLFVIHSFQLNMFSFQILNFKIKQKDLFEVSCYVHFPQLFPSLSSISNSIRCVAIGKKIYDNRHGLLLLWFTDLMNVTEEVMGSVTP